MRGTGRNSEKRRERSKVAARDRRSKESEIFSELSQYLPLPEPTRNALDKASVMRLSLSDLKLRNMMGKVFSSQYSALRRSDGTSDDLILELESLLNNAMGGFLLVLSTEGDIIYVSESVTTHLGLSQVEVMGLNIYDFSHPCDHVDIKELLVPNKKDSSETETGIRSSSFRMKCTITERGRNVHIRAATYKVIDFTGRMLTGTGKNEDSWFVGIGEPLLHPSDVDIPLNKQTFLTKHTPDLKCEFVDDSITTFLGYKPEDLIGQSIFEFYHASDGPGLAKSFKSLYVKGQSITERYRFLAKHGGWVWVVTQATLIQTNGGIKPNSIVCLNFITSGIENEDEIVSYIQNEQPVCKPFKVNMSNFKQQTFVPPKSEITKKITLRQDMEKENILPSIPASKPVPSTTKIFAPRTEDMDTGFLMPCDNTLIVSKEEPEDLTHLAPIAGDESVPLDLPLLDNLLQSLDGNNIKYTMNGYMIDVNLDDLPPLEEPFNNHMNESTSSTTKSSSSSTQPENDDREVPGGSPMSLASSSSPLFLQSDPHMVSSPGSKSSLLSPFQQQQYSPSTRSDKYDYSSPSPSSTMDLQSSPYGENGSGHSSCDDSRSTSSIPGLIGLNLQEETAHSILLQEQKWNGINSNISSICMNLSSSQLTPISCTEKLNSNSTGLTFVNEREMSKYNNNNSVTSQLPMCNTTFDSACANTADNDLMWQNAFNLINNRGCDDLQFVFENNSKQLMDGKKQRAHCYVNERQLLDPSSASGCTNKVFSGIIKGGGVEKYWMDQRLLDPIQDSTVTRELLSMAPQKRSHQMLDIKQEANENFSSCYSSEPSSAKQPKLATQLKPPILLLPSSSSSSAVEMPDGRSNDVGKPQILNTRPYIYGERKRDGGPIPIRNNNTTSTTTNLTTIDYTSSLRNNDSSTDINNRFSLSSPQIAAKPISSVLTKSTTATTTTAFSEIDLKAYVQNLLSSGKSDLINELLTELSNYRKEHTTHQTNQNHFSAEGHESKVVEPPYSTTENMSKSLFSRKLKVENTEKLPNNSVLAFVGLSDYPTEALVELTTLDCEVNAPVNEGSSHLISAAELVKDLDKDNSMDSFV